LEKSLIGVFPPEHTLWYIALTGYLPPAVTAFVASANFRASTLYWSVDVRDANKLQMVAVHSVEEVEVPEDPSRG
jgi:hypothetical protein